MKIERLDHLVLTVKNIDVTALSYESILGMQMIKFAENRVALLFRQPRINLHDLGNEF